MRAARFVFVFLLAASLLSGGTVTAAEDETSSQFAYHVSDAFIQSATGVPQTGAVAAAADGAQVRVSGSGTFNTHSTKATGGGAFVATSAAGAVGAFGTWTATGVASATMYPCGGGGLPANFCGGVVVLKVHITGTSTFGAREFDAFLLIDCEINPPVAGVEGIKLNTPGRNFSSTVPSPGGLTLFVSTGDNNSGDNNSGDNN
jgi:hypothetical protein